MNNLPLSFREQAAIAAMSALISTGCTDNPQAIAQMAVGYADCLEEATKQFYCNSCMTERSAIDGSCNMCGSTNLTPIEEYHSR